MDSVFQFALIEDFHQMEDTQIARTIQFWEAFTLLWKQIGPYTFPDQGRATQAIICSKL